MKYIVLVSVAMLLGSAQWPTVSSVPDGLNDPPIILNDNLVPHEMNFPLNRTSTVLYQGDMILSDKQWRSIIQRIAIDGDEYRWPKDAVTGMVNIDYRYNDANVNKASIKQAIAAWEAATCVRFREIPSAVQKPHLVIKTGTGCNSLVGYQSSMNGQDINLEASCYADNGVIQHEFGHALGLFHEQSRSDRDLYLTMLKDNFETGNEAQFALEKSNNFGLPYDYSSVMFYFPTEMNKNGQYTYVTKNPLAMVLLTAPIHMSFMDKKIVNLMYKCTDTWLTKCGMTIDPCKNQGYTRADCKCECPEGTSGANCETLNMPYTEALIKAKSPNSRRIITEGTITSPGYPTPESKETITVQYIEAPECKTVQLSFTAFDMADKSEFTAGTVTTKTCDDMKLRIQLDDPPARFDDYCGGNFTAPKTFDSVGRFMVLSLTTKAMTGNTKTGYSATVKFVNATGKCTPSPGKITNSGVLPVTPSNSSGLCKLVSSSSNPSIYTYSSPNYPSNYSSRQNCSMWFNTTEPRYLKVTTQVLQLGLFDIVSLFYAHQTTTNLNSGNVGKALTLPTSSSRLNFQDSSISPTGKFQVNVEVVNSACHQLIELNIGSTGPLSIAANYPAGTICEWWLRAPPGRKVQVSFSKFAIGNVFCSGDFALIDLAGDSRYATRTTRYCGGNSPKTVVSTGNALNILVNGLRGMSQGLTAIYTVV